MFAQDLGHRQIEFLIEKKERSDAINIQSSIDNIQCGSGFAGLGIRVIVTF